jgi:hypothetical protein
MVHEHEAGLKRLALEYRTMNRLNRPAKVTNIVEAPMFWSEGFVTSCKFIGGRSLNQVEQILGLPVGELVGGAYFYEFMLFPTPDEIELEGYSQCPDVKPWTPARTYPPGLGTAQWRIKPKTFAPSRLAAIVSPGGKIQ